MVKRLLFAAQPHAALAEKAHKGTKYFSFLQILRHFFPERTNFAMPAVQSMELFAVKICKCQKLFVSLHIVSEILRCSRFIAPIKAKDTLASFGGATSNPGADARHSADTSSSNIVRK